ncbi:hypothetical protein PR048_022698 [Dryococelus australis]|uniref:Uncharacterized protein n=1 Tax=Dryococelus australis TaxID=614101 RepID=A0ABQ9GS42_9NEOP|nr:hypothetical protein PR048_022698 [Dryococelus australis]
MRRGCISNIPILCETRWCKKCKCIAIFKEPDVQIVMALETLSKDGNITTRKAAFQMHCAATNSKFIVCVCLIAKYSPHIKHCENGDVERQRYYCGGRNNRPESWNRVQYAASLKSAEISCKSSSTDSQRVFEDTVNNSVYIVTNDISGAAYYNLNGFLGGVVQPIERKNVSTAELKEEKLAVLIKETQLFYPIVKQALHTSLGQPCTTSTISTLHRVKTGATNLTWTALHDVHYKNFAQGKNRRYTPHLDSPAQRPRSALCTGVKTGATYLTWTALQNVHYQHFAQRKNLVTVNNDRKLACWYLYDESARKEGSRSDK